MTRTQWVFSVAIVTIVGMWTIAICELTPVRRAAIASDNLADISACESARAKCVDTPVHAPTVPTDAAASVVAVETSGRPSHIGTSCRIDTWIEPGTPAIYQQPYLSDYTPIAVYRNGRQVYDDVPTMVPQADGSIASLPTRIVVDISSCALVDADGVRIAAPISR